MNMTAAEPSWFAAAWPAIRLSLELAACTTVILLLVGTPLAWWLARTRSWSRSLVQALVALPLVLPPSVLGFYLLLGLGPEGPVGRATQALGLGLLPFTFGGLLIGSVLYSMPFVVQPIANAFQAIGRQPWELAAVSGASPARAFVAIMLPLARPGVLTAAVMGFAHTLGEFGVVLMIGGNIPGATRVVSVQLYDQVESLQYAQAHGLAATLLVFSFVVLLVLYHLTREPRRHSA